MLQLGGGVLVPGRNRFLNLEVTRSGHERVSEIHDASLPLFGDGSALMVQKGEEKRAGNIEITGHSRRPGLYAIDENPMLADLLSTADILGPDAYPLIGIIERRDPDTLGKKLIAFPLRLALKGEYNAKLEDEDKIHLFSDADIRRPEQMDSIIAAFLKEQSVTVRGSVRGPGLYPIAEGVTLDNLLAAAGGLSVEADPSRIEISALSQDTGQTGSPKRRMATLTESANITLHAGDAVRVNQKFKRDSKTVLIIGEVTNPGRYDLLEGDKVSDLLQRAGGLTGDAYPDGAIFSRESERKAEEARFRAQAREMQAAIAAALEQDSDKIGAGQIAEARALAMQLQEAEGVGRITVETDPETLRQDPELDMLLQSGDRLYIPKRSLTVHVTGEVLSPVSLQFRKGKKADDYVDEAGGFTMNADKGRTFVVYPDGSAQPVDISSWNSDDLFIPPGSTIVVPRDPEPFDFIQSAKDVSQILSNLAITALFINDVRDE
jgi:protein involved in polysaccharide export with SLBB domain